MLVFENPIAFLFVLLIPMLFILRKFKIFNRVAFPLTLSDWNGKTFTWNGKIRIFGVFLSRVLCILGYIAIIAALAEPVVHHQEKIYTSKGTDILFVLDTSPSMAAKDIANLNRLEAAKTGINTLITENSGASYGLVAMASEAATIIPPTNDYDLFRSRMDSVVIGALGQGSAIGIGLSTAIYHLISSTAKKKCIILVTDGENNAGSVHPETAAELARENGIILYVLGIGTRGSVPLEYVDPVTGKVHSGYYESDFDPSSLMDIAAMGDGRYFGVESISEISSALSMISRRENVIQSFYYKTVDDYYYHKFIILSVVLFGLCWIVRRIFLQEVL